MDNTSSDKIIEKIKPTLADIIRVTSMAMAAVGSITAKGRPSGGLKNFEKTAA
ncbi:hypothetical protein ES703_63426 [subsurface metagenome]